MNANEMYDYLEEKDRQFEYALKIKNERRRKERICDILKQGLNDCGSAFEEQCMVERFKEIYQNHVQAIPA